MFIKSGKIENSEKPNFFVLTNPQGASYEVNYIAAYIWQKLDGNTTLNTIVDEIHGASDDVEPIQLKGIVDDVIGKLQDIQLIQAV